MTNPPPDGLTPGMIQGAIRVTGLMFNLIETAHTGDFTAVNRQLATLEPEALRVLTVGLIGFASSAIETMAEEENVDFSTALNMVGESILDGIDEAATQ